jgi:hypothetical protein
VIERMVILSDDGVLANPLRGHRSTDVIKGHCTQIIRHGALWGMMSVIEMLRQLWSDTRHGDIRSVQMQLRA